MDEDWKIEKRKGACEACSATLGPAEEYVAAISPEGPDFHRREFCSRCWPSQPFQSFFSFWKTQVPPPQTPKRANLEAAWDTFEKLVVEGSADPSRQRLAFLLSLVLLQRRRLKLLETLTRDGKELLRFERMGAEGTVEVINPGIPDTALEDLKTEIDSLLR